MKKYKALFEKILDAREVLKGIKHVTRLDHSTTFSRMSGGNVYLKLENLQKTGSFKVRGAAYAMSQLKEAEKKAGVIAALKDFSRFKQKRGKRRKDAGRRGLFPVRGYP